VDKKPKGCLISAIDTPAEQFDAGLAQEHWPDQVSAAH